MNRLVLFCCMAVCLTVPAWAGKKDTQAELKIIRSGLTDTDREIRIIAAESLGSVGAKEAVEGLKALLSDGSDLVRIKAAIALHQLGDTSGLAELRKILQTKPNLSENPKPLERAKAVARGTIRAEAAKALATVRDTDSAGLLKAMVEDSDGRVADACLIALGKLGNTQAKNSFVSALESTKQEVRTKSAEALGDIGDETCIPALRKRLKDWNRDAKLAAAVALSKLKDRESIPAIRELLLDKDEIAREKAVVALGFMGDTEELTLKAVRKILEDPNGMVRIAAADTLHRLGDDSGKEFLVRALETGDKDAKLKVLTVMGRMGTLKDANVLENLLNDADRSIAIAAARTIVLIKQRAQK